MNRISQGFNSSALTLSFQLRNYFSGWKICGQLKVHTKLRKQL